MNPDDVVLSVSQVQGLLQTISGVESPFLRDFIRTLLVERLCLDWLAMVALQADQPPK